MSIGPIIAHILKHPCQTLKLINRNNIRMFLRTAHHSGIRTSISTTMRVMDNYNKDVERFNHIEEYTAHLNQIPDRLVLPPCGEPLVTIIVPVYNQYHFTMACIDSIIRNSGDVDYEVILADDRSTDETVDIAARVENLVVVRNETNLGFTLNCDHAAEHARGKYLLFLNNDTIVGEDWLKPLVDLIGSCEGIGIVGSKLVYPDGTLQEAGGIIWTDGTAMNYGKGNSPNLPRYNYVKEVDYISGASMMVRRDIFESIGGFDPIYAPAYCEDSDLCLAVRNLGYSVLYQPLSTVIHFEGMTHGKKATVRSNPNQENNIVKLESKWKEYLNANCCRPGTDIFHARDRSQHRQTILLITHYLPSDDMDSENRPQFKMVKNLCGSGYNVKVFPTAMNYDPTYALPLEQMGVEIFYESPAEENLKKQFKNHRSRCDHIILDGYNCARTFVKFLDRHCKAKVHYLFNKNIQVALEREYAITKDPQELIELALYKRINPKLLRRSSSIVTYTAEDAEWVKGFTSTRKVNTIPPMGLEYRCGHKKAGNILLFTGFMGARFNQDAAEWVITGILPLIRGRIPDVEFHIVGGMVPDRLLGLASDDVIFENHQDNGKILDLMNRSAAFLNPMRITAGFRYNAADAMTYGLPVISTSVGAEGFLGLESETFDSADEFAAEIIRVCNDEAYAETVAQKQRAFIERHAADSQHGAEVRRILGE